MKKLVVAALLALSCGVSAAQVQAPAPGSEQASQDRMTPNSSASAKGTAPSYSDAYCAGFVTKDTYKGNFVVGDVSPEVSRMSDREDIFLSGTGFTVGARYSVVRRSHDPNQYELFPGQNAMLNRMGNLYADVGRVRVTRVEKNTAVAVVEFSCEAITIGDAVIPFMERPRPAYRTEKKTFERFADFNGAPSGRIVMGKGFDEFLGTGQKVYLNLGSEQGVKPGDYLRVTRSYDPKNMPPIEKLSLNTPYTEDTQRKPEHPSRSQGKRTPWRGVGEVMVLSTTPTTATAIITYALEDFHLGDVVETQSK